MNFIFDNDRPIYIQLVEQLKMQIVSGRLQPGSKLPSVRELAMQITANPNTVQKAMVELEEQGLVYTERTNGKFVTTDQNKMEEIRKELAKQKMQTYLADMQNLGISKQEAIHYLQEIEGEDGNGIS